MFGKLLRIGRSVPAGPPPEKSVPDVRTRQLMYSGSLDGETLARGKAVRAQTLAAPARAANALPLPEAPAKYATLAARLPGALAATGAAASPPAKYETFATRLPGVLPGQEVPMDAPGTAAYLSVDAQSLPQVPWTPEAGANPPAPPSPQSPEGGSTWDSTARG